MLLFAQPSCSVSPLFRNVSHVLYFQKYWCFECLRSQFTSCDTGSWLKLGSFLWWLLFPEKNIHDYFLLHFFNRCTEVRRCALHSIEKTLIRMPSWNEGSRFNKQILSISKQELNHCFGSKFKCFQVLLSAFSSMSPPDTVLLKYFLEHLVQSSTNISTRDEITLSRISYSMR